MTRSKPSLVLVNYLNTLPFLEGLRAHFGEEVSLELAHPAHCAVSFFSGKADYGLIPVGALLANPGWRLAAAYGIACDGPVDTVCLYGETPLETWDTVHLDYQSRTSVLLAEYLLREYWHSNARLIPARPGFESDLQGDRGGLIIGDRTIEASARYPFKYDLGHFWKALTGLPFVFAAWVGRDSKENALFETSLHEAFAFGLSRIDAIVLREQPRYPSFDLDDYYRRAIRYPLDDRALEGMRLFMEVAPVKRSV